MKKSAKRIANIIGDKSDIGERIWTRLWKDDEREVTQLITDDKSQSTVVRDLVSEALHAKRLKQAGRNPAIRELLKTFDEMISVRVQQATQPLAQRVARIEAEQRRTNRFLAAIFLTMTEKFEFAPDEPDEATDRALFAACADEANEMSKLILEPQPDTPADDPQPVLKPIVARELTT